MILHRHSLPILMLCIFFLFFCGILIFVWGQKLKTRGYWLLWIGLFSILGGIGVDGGLFSDHSLSIQSWTSGWIGDPQDLHSIKVGVLQDFLGLAMSFFSVMIAGLFLCLKNKILFHEKRAEKIFSALAFSTAGMVIAWIAVPLWLNFSGIFLTSLGGFLAISARCDDESEAGLAAYFLSEKAFGFLVGFCGACILSSHDAVSGVALLSQGSTAWIGYLLVLMSLLIFTQPFPLLGWRVCRSNVFTPAQTLLCQIFPTWATFVLLLRLDSELSLFQDFQVLAWVSLLSALLAFLGGLFQTSWKESLGAWLVGGFSVVYSSFIFNGPLPALSLLIGMSLAGLCFSLIGSCSHKTLEKAQTQRPLYGSYWIRCALFLAAASGTGMIGFVSATGGLRWIYQSTHLPLAIALFCIFNFFLFALLGWKLSWKISHFLPNVRSKESHESYWSSIVVLYCFIFLSLGVVWTGNISANVIYGFEGLQFLPVLFDHFFTTTRGSERLNVLDLHREEFLSVSALYWGIVFLAFLSAYWGFNKRRDKSFKKFFLAPRITQFIAEGYGVETPCRTLYKSLQWLGQTTENLVDYQIWSKHLPSLFYLIFKWTSIWINQLDIWLSNGLISVVKRGVNTSAKVLQRIHTGDVQWSLFFILCSAFALLFKILKL